MADLTLQSSSRFPAGTTVEAYPVTNWPAWQRDQIEGAPVGADAASAVVAADGTLTFSGLTDFTSYVAYALVGGEHRYVRFRPGAKVTPTFGSFADGQVASWDAAAGQFVGLTAAAVGHTHEQADVTGLVAALAAKQDAATAATDAELTAHEGDTLGVHGIADTALLDTIAAREAALTAHEADTTNVHGIADTSVLATDADLATHEADTTSVHGIADTAQVALKDAANTFTQVQTFPAAGVVVGASTLYQAAAAVLASTSQVSVNRAAAGNTAFGASVTGDADNRFRVMANGDLRWGDGTAALDAFLTREAAAALSTSGKFRVGGELEVDGALNHDGTTVGFYGVAPVARAAAIAAPTGGVAQDTEARAAINSIRAALTNIGITS